MLRLRTFGGLSIERSSSSTEGGAAPSSATAARRRLALLAVLAASGPRGVPRDKLLALFWPESDSDRARHALDQALYALKRDLGAEGLVTGREEPALNPAAITSDVEDFKAALTRGDRAAAVELYTGPFLDGVFISGAPAFERWAEEERGRLTREVEQAIEALATEAAKRGEHGVSVQRWQRLAAMEPRKTRVVLALMSELAASGDRAGALRHAEVYHTLVRDDLDGEPNPAVQALAEKLKREPTGERKAMTPPPAPPIAPTAPLAPQVPPDVAMPNGRPAGGEPRRSRLTVEWLRHRATRAYRLAGAAVGVAVLLGLTLAWVLAGRRTDAGRTWILQANLENRTGDSVFDRAIDAALAAGLQQSTRVNVVPRARVEQTLTLMERPRPGEIRVDPELAREIAQRQGVKLVVAAAIDRVDTNYLLTARLIDAGSGAALAAESRVSKGRAGVIDALDDVVRRLRHDIGESASAIQQHDLPLPQATTRSLEALRKYAEGNAAFRAGQRKAAFELWRQAVALDSNFALAHAQLGASYYWNNDRPNGDAHFERALALLDRLTDRERFQVRASAESWRGNREGAIELRRALLAQYPNDPAAWGQIGYDYMRLGRAREAIAAYRVQIARDSSDPAIYINMASAYKDLRDYEQAIRQYRHAFALQPSLLTLENLNEEYGETLVLVRRFDEARATFDTMLAGDADQRARGHRSLGLLAMAEGKYGEAIQHFRDAILLSAGPRHELTLARNRLFLAVAEQEKGWTDSARAELRAVHAAFRQSYFEPRFLLFMGKVLARDGEVALASEVLDSLRRRARATNHDDVTDERVLTAEVLLARGRSDSAVELLRLAFAMDSNPLNRESLAHAVARAGGVTEAMQHYAILRQSANTWYGWEPEHHGLTATVEEGALYEQLGDRDRARAAYERLLAQWPAGDTDLASVRRARGALGRLRALDSRR